MRASRILLVVGPMLGVFIGVNLHAKSDDDPVVSVTHGPGGTAIITRDGAARPKTLDEAGARLVQLEKRIAALEKYQAVVSIPALGDGKPKPVPVDSRPPLKQTEFLATYAKLRPTFDDRFGEHPDERKAAEFRKFQKQIGLDRKVQEWTCTFAEIPSNQGRGTEWIIVNCDYSGGKLECACFLRSELKGKCDEWFDKLKKGQKLIIVSGRMQEFGNDHPLISDCTFDDPANSWRAKERK